MEYMTVSKAVEKWGICRRAITYHLVDGRIPGAVKKGNMWLIPKDVARPEDRRKGRRGKPVQGDADLRIASRPC